jgi:F-type H+-transporting ATPase subunit epsilon
MPDESQKAVQTPVGSLRVELCAPECDPSEFEAHEAVIPGAMGVFTVLPGHTPMLSTLGTGVVYVRCADGAERYFAVNGGFVQIVKDRLLVLAQTAESESEVDAERAKAALERAEKRLDQRDEPIDTARAEAALARAMARLQTTARQGF